MQYFHNGTSILLTENTEHIMGGWKMHRIWSSSLAFHTSKGILSRLFYISEFTVFIYKMEMVIIHIQGSF